jgi:hypothetical protein
MALKKSQDFFPFYCNICDIYCHKKNVYEKHILTAKHQNREKTQKSAWEKIPKSHIFSCEYCEYKSDNKKDYKKHLLTSKHNNALGPHGKNPLTHICQNCGNTYASQSGLWRHKQKCAEKSKTVETYDPLESETDSETASVSGFTIPDDEPMSKQKMQEMITPELVIMLIQQNKEMQKMMMDQMMQQNQTMLELAKNGGHNTTNIQNNNNINKAFNINFFLNETCKNAMNMSDFVKNMVVTTDDFEQTGSLGYVQGISRIMENELRKLEVHERPIHCTDLKRETIYIKDNDKWEKDDDKKSKLLEVIKQVGAKNINMIPQWCKEHPGWSDHDSKENDRYLNYVFNSMCGETTQEINHNYGKIMRNISRITMVDKQEAVSIR